jgi:hypothetical protein
VGACGRLGEAGPRHWIAPEAIGAAMATRGDNNAIGCYAQPRGEVC